MSDSKEVQDITKDILDLASKMESLSYVHPQNVCDELWSILAKHGLINYDTTR